MKKKGVGIEKNRNPLLVISASQTFKPRFYNKGSLFHQSYSFASSLPLHYFISFH
jgi:hypothetical protein